jgi:hypothetical protein
MSRRGARSVLWVGLCLACAPTEVPLDSLLAQGEANPDRAGSEYRGQELRVRGAVAEVAVKTADNQRRDQLWTGERIPPERWTEHVGAAYVVVLPAGHARGAAVCWFDEGERRQLGSVAVGDVVTVWGTAREFKNSPKHGPELVMDGCVIDSRTRPGE